MVYVRLQRDWTDGDGAVHAAGETVDVDVSTLAQLESSGVVSDPGTDTHADAVHRVDAADESGDGAGGDEGDDGGGGGDEGDGDDGGGDDDIHSWVGPTSGTDD